MTDTISNFKYYYCIYSFIFCVLIECFFYYLLCRIMAKIDNDMLKYYCNEDMFLLEVRHAEENENMLDIVLIEFMDH